MRKFVTAKLHGITVTGADLDYHGSITLDPDHCEMAGIMPLEFVYIWNKNSGARISTYVIYGERGSRCCVLNGAAARTCQKGDVVIITGCRYADSRAVFDQHPTVLTFDRDNNVEEVLRYTVGMDDEGRHTFAIETMKAKDA